MATLFVACSLLLISAAQGQWTTPDPWYRTSTYAQCGGSLLGSRGKFNSPNYPGNYPNNAYCVWYIQTSGGNQVIQLDFPFVSLEKSSNCQYDAISVYDGSSTRGRLLGKLCDRQSSSFHSTGANMTVKFQSDGSQNHQGFQAEYQLVAEGSCRYNCGHQMGNCSCSYLCEYNGNCCQDYRNHCPGGSPQPETTTALETTMEPTHWPMDTTADRDLCRYNCGYNVGHCSCHYNCRYYGNCCHSYYEYCEGTTAVTPTAEGTYETSQAQRSCRYNCGSNLGSCSCSSSCQYYGNCCHDYSYYCASTTQDAPTTAQRSCRYNCGSNLGSCSCSSSCQYYGNCCHDYSYYCASTTQDAPTTAQRSCRYNCGSNLGSCSCSSSCQRYGNCCYDYSSYCPMGTNGPYTTAAPHLPCGENLYGSGSFTSPYYPGYYHDNANCVWQLSVPAGQRVYLSFTSLELENCCNCDYVAVYDGPSVNSRPLGKLCSGGNTTLDAFHSSSSYLTVVFRSDRSVVSRGFQAQFSSSLPASTGRVDCSSDIMNIVVSRSYLNSLGYDGYNLYLNDQHCRPSVSSYQVVFSFPINTCGTVRKFVNERVVYTNALRATPSNSGEISRQSQFKLNVECHMEKDIMVQNMYQANEVSNSSITGSGRFNGTMAFYHSSNFYNQVTEVPFKVKLNQDLYVQVSLRRSDSSLVLFLDTCVASPSPHDFQTRSYDLVRNGCPRDNTYRPYLSGNHSYARFTFKAFKFLRTHEFVYLQCKVIICQASDYNSRCRRGCSSRKARALGSNHDSHTLVLGPIQRQDLEKEGELPQPEVKDEVKA
ncbi:deleted in malignant brain tumors 1 protein-like [Hypomesus transpacificus]|uniref:deleted in malignant brain tumors 1 protein-like n=1 Tax=Hypomesus transpacificus TaxID=137520 RepID=UPI001F07DC3F|nr:deleted in malignant brain tumors 1 protein-like [Hypomesus transpacificus]